MFQSLHFSRSVIALMALGSLSFCLLRLALWLTFGDTEKGIGTPPDWLAAGVMGVRFDLKVLSHGILLSFVPMAGLVCLPRLVTASAWLQRISVALLLFAVNLTAIAQFYYYDFYHSPFSPIVFGLLEDDTTGVLASMWADYPVLRASFVLIGLTALQSWVVFRWAGGAGASGPPRRRAWRVTLVLIGLGVAARGSFDTFPLRDQNATVSSNAFVNDLVRNPWQALYDAARDRRAQIDISTEATAGLRRYGFFDLPALASALGAQSAAPSDLEALAFSRTPKRPWLETHPPHVVVALMESWGAHPMRFDDEKTHLTGAFRKHLSRSVTHPAFVSAQNGTHPTLEALLLNTPLTPLTQGENGRIALRSAAALPFREHGYRTVFVYGGSNVWRGIGRALPNQGFDEVYDMGDILARYPKAERTVWGVYDEYLFRFAGDLMSDARRQGKPVLLFLLSTTNHPPHSLPADYRAAPINVDATLPILNASPDRAARMLETYQYSSHQLGRFLDRLDALNLSGRTVVAATGDHNLRTLFRYRMPDDALISQQVMTYLNVPAAYRPPGENVDLTRISGHADIFPTLHHLALSDAHVPAFGQSLFTVVPEHRRYAVMNFQTLLSDAGSILAMTDSASSRLGIDRGSGKLSGTPADISLLDDQARDARARLALQDWYTRWQIIEGRARGKQ
ncbi:Phosphoglycerol transferase I [Pandoraea terrae]|uniref:Phosphoglycerol transferase I n=1 Tax=Pandoraea terrae TaxID=1537710 RepID=A0A5E4YKS9_9BURK|nr:LTA synthase family protein [Pandoraea terrae]VVE49020.1 Phosphoglycerol transferase I [Pandoraea terrae]